MRSLLVRSRILLSGLTLWAVTGQVTAGNCPDADAAALEWLDKMSRSSHEVSYHGVVTFQRGDNMQVMQVSHSVVDGTASESLTQLTGQGAQVVRVDHPLQCVHPGHRLLRVGTDMREGDCGIANHYRFSVGEGERIAGRGSVRIEIEPRDMYRYGYVMELDQETGLLLKTQTLGHGNKVLERFQFANLSYTAQDTGTGNAEVVHRASHPHPLEQSDSPPSDNGWKLRWLPTGFMATDSSQGDTSRKTFTDGLAVFSVFIEKLSTKIQPGEGVVRRGGTTSYSRGMAVSGQYVLVTVIGEVPLNTARLAADSIEWAQ